MIGTTSFAQFVIEEQRRAATATGDLSALLHDVSTAVKSIAVAVSRRQQKVDLVANQIMLDACGWGGHLAGMVSGEVAGVCRIPDPHPRGKYLLAFDPLDGSSNIDINLSVGTIFSILRRPGGPGDAETADFLQPGCRQVCAGYAIYGPSTMLVVTLGQGVHGFTLDRELGEFFLTHPALRIPETACELSINSSNERFWEPPVARYVKECLAGCGGPRQVDFNMRWVASLVADVHRILLRGGVYLYPCDSKEPLQTGRLRLLYEAAPMAFIVEQAGGGASTGRGRLLDVVPAGLHERVAVILGSGAEVERIARYHDEHARGVDTPYRSPLFARRSLFSEPRS